MSLKLAILGATGPTGLLLVDQALARGHQVIAVVRNPDRLGSERLAQSNLTVKRIADMSAAADSEEQKLLAEAFTGCDVVLSALGAGISFYSAINLMTQAVPAIVTAMRTAGVTRLILLTAQCTVYHRDHPKVVEWVIKPLFIGRNLADFARAENHLAEHCGDINYTVVKPPGLTNKPLDPRQIKAEEGQFVRSATEMGVPRANVAQFMLDCAESAETWSKKLVAIQF